METIFFSKWDYEKRFKLYNNIIQNEKLDGEINYLEFGVASGESFEWLMRKNTHASSSFYGFDTFTGLPEDFGQYKKVILIQELYQLLLIIEVNSIRAYFNKHYQAF